MSEGKSYSMEEVDLIMSTFVEKSADELMTELRLNWSKQEDKQYA